MVNLIAKPFIAIIDNITVVAGIIAVVLNTIVKINNLNITIKLIITADTTIMIIVFII